MQCRASCSELHTFLLDKEPQEFRVQIAAKGREASVVTFLSVTLKHVSIRLRIALKQLHSQA